MTFVTCPESQNKLLLVGDYVRALYQQWIPWLYVATNASRHIRDAITQELYALRASYIVRIAHFSPESLFDLLEQHSDKVIILDQAWRLFEQPEVSQMIIDSFSVGGAESLVTLHKNGRERQLLFDGFLIMLSDRPPESDGMAELFKHEEGLLRVNFSRNEIEAEYHAWIAGAGDCLSPADVEYIASILRDGDHDSPSDLNLLARLQGLCDVADELEFRLGLGDVLARHIHQSNG